MVMSFNEFLSDSMDVPGRVAKFAKLLFGDVDNGCGRLEYDAIAWKQHFIDKHPDSPQLIHMLVSSYAEYIKTIKSK